MTVVIVGVDPGKSCGLAVLTDGRLSFVSQATPEIMLRQLRTVIGFALTTYSPNLVLTVVCERFVDRKGPMAVHTNQSTTLEVIGAVETVCRETGVPFILQNPADAKAMAQNDRLRLLGLWVTPKDLGYTPDADDARDAIRHAVLRLATKHATIFSRLLGDAGKPAS